MTRTTASCLMLLLALPAGSGCRSSVEPARPARTATPPPPGAPATRYRVGDFVEYRYRGTFTAAPVVFRETVRAQEGNRLRIDIVVTRGSEERRWVQILTDTPENQRNNVIDALYEWKDGRYVKLGGELMREAFRLYAWTILMPDGRATDVAQRACTQVIAGTSYACRCTTGKNALRGKALRFEDSVCPDFLWTHGPGFFVDAATGEDILRMEVGAAGRDPGARALTLDPTQDPR